MHVHYGRYTEPSSAEFTVYSTEDWNFDGQPLESRCVLILEFETPRRVARFTVLKYVHPHEKHNLRGSGDREYFGGGEAESEAGVLESSVNHSGIRVSLID